MANIEISTILANLGFELDADDEEFIEDVARLADAGDIEGLTNRIAGGATYGESRELAERIIEAAEEETETADDYSRRKPETRVGGAWSRRSRGD